MKTFDVLGLLHGRHDLSAIQSQLHHVVRGGSLIAYLAGELTTHLLASRRGTVSQHVADLTPASGEERAANTAQQPTYLSLSFRRFRLVVPAIVDRLNGSNYAVANLLSVGEWNRRQQNEESDRKKK